MNHVARRADGRHDVVSTHDVGGQMSQRLDVEHLEVTRMVTEMPKTGIDVIGDWPGVPTFVSSTRRKRIS